MPGETPAAPGQIIRLSVLPTIPVGDFETPPRLHAAPFRWTGAVDHENFAGLCE